MPDPLHRTGGFVKLLWMQSFEIREKFLSFFEGVGHRRVKSSALIPAQDPTLLFTNAGMVQFKDCFLGIHDPGYRRAVTAQKCVRAGGKHNDLENVGFTPRHHTFFEMLGNFSFGDYFKKDAIAFAWELLTRQYGIPKDRLRITVFQDDDEAAEIWKAMGVRADWIVRLGEKDNFWAMGDTGPCGPCSEIHFDWGESRGCGKPTCAPGCPCDTRFLEIWNLVFMQFNRDPSGTLAPLPKPSVDTGAGLERLSAVLQGVYSNYDTDLFQPLIQAISKKVGVRYDPKESTAVSMRVIADHLRAGTFLIADGVGPSNEGRGYVLRRILRRAIRHGKKLNQDAPFLYQLVSDVVSQLEQTYPEISERKNSIETLLQEEEARFHQTLHRGVGLLDESLAKLPKSGARILPGDVAFKLYDTFGFPVDLIQVICAENGVSMDEAGFQILMEKQRSQSTWTAARADGAISSIQRSLETAPVDGTRIESLFVGYEKLMDTPKVLKLWNEQGVETTSLTADGFAAFDRTPFYSESGGQVGDSGSIVSPDFRGVVSDTRRVGAVPVHSVHPELGSLKVGTQVRLVVDEGRRKAIAINHTATHLLHAALRQVLGDRVKQAGSLVGPDKLRFDFSFPRALTDDEISKIESLVNVQIDTGLQVVTSETSYDEAVKGGALAFFEDKYGDRVRVVRVGSDESRFSVELCGGTHLQNIADIQTVKILSESSVASGVRRIEAVTAKGALNRYRERDRVLENIETSLGVRAIQAVSRVDTLSLELKTAKKELERLKMALAQGGGGTAPWEKRVLIRDLQVVMERVSGVNAGGLRTLSDQIRDKLKDRALVVLATENEGKVSMCVGISKDLSGRLDASKIVKSLAQDIGGTGGGRADFAQAGGTNPSAIDGAFAKLKSALEKQDIG